MLNEISKSSAEDEYEYRMLSIDDEDWDDIIHLDKEWNEQRQRMYEANRIKFGILEK